jgi:ribosomal protein S18 acetylase RimI-like enzyme
MKLRVLKGERVFEADFIEAILELDKANMQAIMDDSGIEFPEANRRAGFKNKPTFIVAETRGGIAGYLEYTRSWTDAGLIYLSSMQIAEKYRHSKLLLRLIDKFIETVEAENFKGFETNVQKNNRPAVKLYRKIGFRFEENPRRAASWRLTADRRILSESPVRDLIDRWRKR